MSGDLQFLSCFVVPLLGRVLPLLLLNPTAQIKCCPTQAKMHPVRRGGVGIVFEQLPQCPLGRGEFIEPKTQFPLM